MFYTGASRPSSDELAAPGSFEMKVFRDYVGLVSESFLVVNSELVTYHNASCSIIYDL